MKHTWLKLYFEIIDDPKMGRLPDWLWRRAIELFLMAGEHGKDGLLPPVGDMAWRLRTPVEMLIESLQALAQVGIMHETAEGWVVTHYKARQYSESYDRVKRYRNAKSNDDSSSGSSVTVLSTSTSNSLILNSEGEGVGEGTNPTLGAQEGVSSVNTAMAIAMFGDNSIREAEQLYTRITGQVTFPPSWDDKHIGALTALLYDHFDRSVERAADSGKAVFTRYCNTRSKTSGRNYSRTGAGWLDWWLAEVAPEPESDGQAHTFNLPRPTLICRDGEKIYNRCKSTFGTRSYDNNVSEFQTHLNTCHLCGGSSNITDVTSEIGRLVNAKKVSV